MTFNKIILTLTVLALLMVSTFTVIVRPYANASTPEATLTGNILDHGVDTNNNGLYDYLEVDVQVNVTAAGNFFVTGNGLVDQSGNYISIFNSSQSFLNLGIQYINFSFFGPTIFISRINPQNVSIIQLSTVENMFNYTYLGGIFNVPLSRVYSYTEFEPSSAFLTGHISDRGVDTDGDGLFNYLQVGIEFNVTQDGNYKVSAQGLIEKTGSTTKNYFYDYQYDGGNFTVGTHTFYVNFSGSGIASQRLNPTDVNYIEVYDITNQVQTSWLDSAPLAIPYNYTAFNAPSQDIKVNFKVYPDATVAVDGGLNFTHMYPENTFGPQINATMGFSTVGNVTTETSNGTMVFPENQYSNYDGIEAHLSSVYGNGLENDTANASMILTPEEAGYYPFNTTDINLNAAYSGGLFDVAITGQTVIPTAYSTIFPFNVSDATVRIDFDGTKLGGNITFHSIPGFPLADVTVYFSGNKSSLHFTGDVNVTYSSFNGFQVNETILDQTLADLTDNVTGQGPSSLYNMTGGYLECTNVNVTKTSWSDPTLGADVTYDATIIGNFTGALARMMFPPGSPGEFVQPFAYASLESAASSVRNASLVLTYYHSLQMAQIDLHLTCDVQALCNNLLALAPPAIPSSWASEQKQIEAMLKVANATAYALTDAGVNASYSSADRKMSLNAWLLANDSQLKNDLIDILPDLGPPEMHDLLASYFNTTYSFVNSSTTTFDMLNGTATFASQTTLQGDFEAQLNQEKTLLIAVINSTLPSSLPPTWELQALNETEINLNNFRAEFDLGTDRMYANFSGLILKPQPDSVDTITFKLKTWLNMMTGPNVPPVDFEKLTITVTGASNANQTVLLSQPPEVPSPDYFSLDGKTMTWNNASLSSLQDLMFLEAYEGQASYGGGTYPIPIFTNSTVSSFGFDAGAKQITFDVTGPSGTLGFCNVTIPRNLLNASALSDWIVIFDGKPLGSGEFNITENAEYVFVYLNYTHSEHVISISSTQLVPEFQPDILPLALIIPLVIAAIIAVKKRRKLEPMKAKLRQTLARARLSPKPN